MELVFCYKCCQQRFQQSVAKCEAVETKNNVCCFGFVEPKTGISTVGAQNKQAGEKKKPQLFPFPPDEPTENGK